MSNASGLKESQQASIRTKSKQTTERASGSASKRDLSIFKQMCDQPNYCSDLVCKKVCQVFR